MALDRIRLGTAPDSWGVWFPDAPGQVPWTRFLDEAADAGYRWVELGPYGYLPTDPCQLADELSQRGLRLSGGAVFAGLHHGAEALKQAVEDCRQEARLLTALGARHLILLPEGYTDLAGHHTQPDELTAEEWAALCDGMSRLGKILAEEFGLSLVFHPHADSHVASPRQVKGLLRDTDPATVSLCLDTGHIAYCGGDNSAIVDAFPERIGYLHLKQVDPVVLEQVRVERLCFAEAVRRRVMTEPPQGAPAIEPLLHQVAELDVDLFAIVEQDLYPCDPDVPLPIARRTAGYLASCGLGPVRPNHRSGQGSLQKGKS